MALNAVSHLLRRQADMDDGSPQWPGSDHELHLEGVPAAVVFTTVAAFFIIWISVNYTLSVVGTLVMIETPRADLILRDPDFKPTDSLLEDGPDAILVQQKPITSSIRGTIRHLTSRGGFTARWRGLSISVATDLMKLGLIFLFNMINQSLSPLWNILATVALSRFIMGWTHIVMTEPSSERWTRRLLPMKSWKDIAAPTAIQAVVKGVVSIPPVLISLYIVNRHQPEEGDSKGAACTAALALGAFMLTYLMLFITLYIPATVSLARCQASLLHESEEPIVPFDRTFGNRIEPGTRIGYFDAWRSIGSTGRTQVLKFYAKSLFIQIALATICTVVVAAELIAFKVDMDNLAKHPEDAIHSMTSYAANVGLR